MLQKIVNRIRANRADVKSAQERLQMAYLSFIGNDEDGIVIPASFVFIKVTRKKESKRYYFYMKESPKTIYVVLGQKERQKIKDLFKQKSGDEKFIYKSSLEIQKQLLHLFVQNGTNMAALMSEEGDIKYLPALESV